MNSEISQNVNSKNMNFSLMLLLDVYFLFSKKTFLCGNVFFDYGVWFLVGLVFDQPAGDKEAREERKDQEVSHFRTSLGGADRAVGLFKCQVNHFVFVRSPHLGFVTIRQEPNFKIIIVVARGTVT